jgi:DNA polymerase III alpha subunit
MKVSPHTHVESHLTGSTIANMIDKAKALGRTHFAHTDHGHLSSCLKTYSMVKKAGLKFIPGIEFYFKDALPIHIGGSELDRCKYFSATLFCEDQDAYQALCKMISGNDFPTIEIYEEIQQLWSLEHLKHMAQFNVNLVLGGVHDIVGKAVLAGHPDIAEAIFVELNTVFKDKLFVSIICETWTRKWNSVVEIELTDGTKVSCLSTDQITTDRARRFRAMDLLERSGHTILKSIFSNNISREVNLGIKSVKLHKGFLPLGVDALLEVNKFLWSMAYKYNNPVMPSDYAYYANKEDKIVQTMRLETTKLQSNFYMKSGEEIKHYLKDTMGFDGVITQWIMSGLNLWISRFDKLELKYDWRLPDSGGIPIEQAMEIIKKNGRMKWDNPTYVSRLREELLVISKNGVKDLIGYFLPICDVMTHYKENGKLVGPARGSAAGSLLAYLLGITQVDSIKADLSFPRFLSIDRIKNGDYPDLDSDFGSRELLVGEDGKSGYLYGRWGTKAAQISTRHTLRLKSAIKDVNRYLNGKVEQEIEMLTKALPDPPQGVSDAEFIFGYEDKEGVHYQGLIDIDETLQKYVEKRPQEWEIVRKSLGLTRAFSQHASAFVIADIPISDIVPTKEGNITQYEAKAVEQARLLKYDFLVVSQIQDIETCLNLINKKNNENNTIGYFTHKGEKRYIWDLPEDPDVFKSVWDGNTETIFQINTKAMIPFVKDILPQSVEDISIIQALVRPGAMDYIDENTGRSMAEEYVWRRQGKSEPDFKRAL